MKAGIQEDNSKMHKSAISNGRHVCPWCGRLTPEKCDSAENHRTGELYKDENEPLILKAHVH